MVGIFAGQLQTKLRNTGRTDLISTVARFGINIPARLVTTVANSVGDFFIGIIHSGQLTEENRRLRAIAEAEAAYNTRLNDLESHLDQLVKLQHFEVPGRKRIPARIIGVFPDENRATLSAGSSEGIVAGIPVIAGDGLLGTIQTVDSHTSQVAFVWSPLPYKIGAIVAGKPGVAGLLHGESSDALILDLGINATVQTGDLVVTSGFSEKIPPGLPIGRVVQVQQDRDFGTTRAQVFPNVQLGDVQEVIALR